MDKFSQNYTIKSYNSDVNSKLKLLSLLEFFQDMADMHAAKYNFGYEYCKANNFGWILTHYHIKINEMPSWSDTITIDSWPSHLKRIACRRDFCVHNKDKIAIQAATQWVTITLDTHKPISIKEHMPHLVCLEEFAIETNFSKIPDIITPHIVKQFPVYIHNIDTNNHVNNSVYFLWAYEGFNHDWSLNKELKEIEIQFKNETFLSDTITVTTQIIENVATQSITTQDNKEVARVRTTWA